MSASVNNTNSGGSGPASAAARPWRIAHNFPVQPEGTLLPGITRTRPAAPIAVAVADKAALIAQAQGYKAIVADDDALQTKQFVKINRLPPGLAYRSAPALNAFLWRVLAFDLEA